jgi:S-adenosylmethionine decarboxylase
MPVMFRREAQQVLRLTMHLRICATLLNAWISRQRTGPGGCRDCRIPTVVPPVLPALYSIDLAGCVDLVDRAPEEILATFAAALRRAGATVVHELSHAFPDTGLTCVLILSESHAVLHTWPETGTVNIDIFSCSTRLKSHEAIDELRRSFGAQHVTMQEIPRADGYGPRSDGRS